METTSVAVTSCAYLSGDPDWVNFSQAERANICAREEAMMEIDRSQNKFQACRSIAAQNAHRDGWSEVRLRTLYYEWRNARRSWRTLANFARSQHTSTSLARRLQDIYKRYAGENQRAAKPAYRLFLTDLRRGVRFEGVGDWRDLWQTIYNTTPPAECPGDWIPPGLSYTNIQHIAKLTRHEQVALRIGMRAARALLPPVWTTRVGLLPGQVLEVDDVHHDVKVNVLGVNERAMRPLEFVIMDVASACHVGSGLKPELIREDGSVERLSARREFKVVLAQYLMDTGFRNDDHGTTILGEHGTAALNNTDRQILLRITGGRVRFEAGGVEKLPAHRGLFAPKGKGNFRLKGLLEGGGGHLLLHNTLAMIPGQVGSNSRTSEVEELASRDDYNKALLKACATISPEKLRLIAAPFTPWSVYREIVPVCRDALDRRTDHHIEGFESNGWIVIEWRAGEGMSWMPLDSLQQMSPTQAEHCRKLSELPGNSRTRLMSPREVMDRHRHELTRLPFWSLVDFLGEDFRRRLVVGRRGEFEFNDCALGPDKHRYMSLVKQPDGSAMRLPAGREYWLTILPTDPSRAIVTDTDGSVLGISLAVTKVDRLNTRAIELAQELQSVQAASLLAPLRSRHAQSADILSAQIAGNRQILESATATTPPPDDLPDQEAADATEEAISMLESVTT
jgi:hypothetical protein